MRQKPTRWSEKIEQAGGKAISAQADVSDAAAVGRMFASAEQAFGGVDVLVNNAGIMTLSAIAETDDAAFDRLIDINLKGTFNTLHVKRRNICTTADVSSISHRRELGYISRLMACVRDKRLSILPTAVLTRDNAAVR